MPDILIDKTQGNQRHTLHRCYSCDHSKYPRGRVIMPYDKHAIHTKSGKHICGTCAMEMNRKIVDGMMNRRITSS